MLLSIIIPIYNSKQYLNKCISSIVSQLDTDAEIICVDDGSTDGSEVICDKFAAIYDNVKVFHKPNGGVSSAHNLGLENAVVNTLLELILTIMLLTIGIQQSRK